MRHDSLRLYNPQLKKKARHVEPQYLSSQVLRVFISQMLFSVHLLHLQQQLLQGKDLLSCLLH